MVTLMRHPASNPAQGDEIDAEDVCTQWETTLNSQFDTSYKPHCVLTMSNGERGCAMSHLQLWRKVRMMRNCWARTHISQNLGEFWQMEKDGLRG